MYLRWTSLYLSRRKKSSTFCRPLDDDFSFVTVGHQLKSAKFVPHAVEHRTTASMYGPVVVEALNN
jgi:hypothetical protein